MMDRIATLWPEIALFVTTCIVMILGLSPSKATRSLCAPLCALGLLAAAALAILTRDRAHGVLGTLVLLPGLAVYGKVLVAAMGLMLLPLLSGVADRDVEDEVARGGKFRALDAIRGEFYAFFLFSLTGLMLCTTASDLIWLFLALELTSLPTYVMVAISTRRNRSLESAVKYFFLGALGAAVFLFGFAMLYGGTGSAKLPEIQAELARQMSDTGGINHIALLGLLLSVLGMCFKIAAVPMHFYTADVYQGAASPIAAMLAFVPKAAGFFGIMQIVACAGWGAAGHDLPSELRLVLWAIAVVTMTAGNVLALWQSSIKRVLAYSSIAHSGYMLVGILAGPGLAQTVAGDGEAGAGLARNGLAAVLFYLLCYGVMNLGAFAVLSSLERRGRDGTPEEPESWEELRGLCSMRPLLGWTMVICAVGLLGLPPLLGFIGKVPLFAAGLAAGEVPLVVILGLNSAIAAFYYLRLAATPLLEAPDASASRGLEEVPFPSRRAAGAVSAAGVIVLAIAAGPLAGYAVDAAELNRPGTPHESAETGTLDGAEPTADADRTEALRH